MENKNLLSDEMISALDFTDTNATALTGFAVSHAEPAIGPCGVALLLGSYPAQGPKQYIISVFADDEAGLCFQRAETQEAIKCSHGYSQK